MTMNKDYLSAIRVMPVVVIHRLEDAVPIANALRDGGIKAIEITLRTEVALDAVRAVRQECEGIAVGVGTVINTEQLKEVATIGVDFAVSPGLTPQLVKTAQDLDVNLLPGVASPSEVLLGMELGLECFKLFPAMAVGGLPLLKSMVGPLPQVCFCPTGGLTIDNFTDFLALPNVPCVGGSWLVPHAAESGGNWQGITKIATETLER